MLKRFSSNTKKLNRIIPKVNNNNLNDDLYLTGSLLNIETPSTRSFQSHTRSNPNPTKVSNNKNTINDFHLEILQNTARYTKKSIDSFDNILNTLTINNVVLDYGTEGVSPENFEIMVFGLHIPGDFTIKEINGNVVITLGGEYIDFDSVTLDDIYAFGKFK